MPKTLHVEAAFIGQPRDPVRYEQDLGVYEAYFQANTPNGWQTFYMEMRGKAISNLVSRGGKVFVSVSDGNVSSLASRNISARAPVVVNYDDVPKLKIRW